MSRYFARIAGQVGVPFQGHEGRRAPAARLGRQFAKNSDPLDHHEVTLIPPRPVELTSQPNAHQADRETSGRDTDLLGKRTPKNVVEKNDPGVGSPRNPGENISGQPPTPAKNPDASKASKTREELRFRDVESIAVKQKTLVRKDQDHPREPEPRRPDEQDLAPPNDTHVFFEKTSEVLAGRKAEPEEIRNIVFKEVQDWVAAAPDQDGPLEVESTLPDDRIHELQQQTSAFREEPRHEDVVVSIADRSSARRPNGDAEDRPVEEKFDLSIGTISVTIEGTERTALEKGDTMRREYGPSKGTGRTPPPRRLDRSYL